MIQMLDLALQILDLTLRILNPALQVLISSFKDLISPSKCLISPVFLRDQGFTEALNLPSEGASPQPTPAAAGGAG